jgi:hypothetical protein
MAKKQVESGLTPAAEIVPNIPQLRLVHSADAPAAPEPPAEPKRVSKRTHNKLDRIERVNLKRNDQTQDIGYLPKGFILCGLPFKPVKGGYYERRNGDHIMEIVASPKTGVPFGQDILPIIWVATEARKRTIRNGGICPRLIDFDSAAQILKAFDLPLDGKTYQRMQQRILRVFKSTYYYGRENQRAQLYSFRFFDSVDLWFTRDLETPPLPGDDFVNNRIVLSEAFAKEIEQNPPPVSIEMVKAWMDTPAVLFLGLLLSYRCFTAKGEVRIPLMGQRGLKAQCGVQGYDNARGARNFRGKVTHWLDILRTTWPDCPAHIETTPQGDVLVLSPAKAINSKNTPVD